MAPSSGCAAIRFGDRGCIRRAGRRGDWNLRRAAIDDGRPGAELGADVCRGLQLARNLAHLRDIETGAHLDRMAHYARLIAREIAAARGLDDEFVEHVFLFAPLHDIGKVGVPDCILLKPSSLSEEEKQVMDGHVALGLDMIDRMIADFGLSRPPQLELLRNIVAHHHEYLDGSGYPQGLAADAIPLEGASWRRPMCSMPCAADAATSAHGRWPKRWRK